MFKQKYSDEDELPQQIPVDIKAGELQELIFQKEDNEPKDKRKTIWKIWKKEINEMMTEYNKKFGKVYSLIK